MWTKLQCLPSTVSEVPALRTSAAFAPHSLKLVSEWGFVLRTAGTYACHLRGQNSANAVSELLHPAHGTLYRYISVRQPSADNSSSLGSELISSNAPTYDFYPRELLRSEVTYLLTNMSASADAWVHADCPMAQCQELGPIGRVPEE